VALRSSAGVRYLIGDHLGSTSIIADAAGTKLAEMRYTAYGESRYTSGAMPTEYQYTGQRSQMDEIGLYYYNARWMDPWLGRFAQADSIIPEPGAAVAWDRYSYTSNNPLNYLDPDGHFAIPAMLIGAGIGAIVGGAISGATYAITNQGENFEWGEFAVAAGGGAIAGALVGSGIGLVTGAVSAATAAVGATMVTTAEAVAAVSATSTSLISAGASAGISGLSYMTQTPGNFEASPYLIGSAVSGVVGYYSPGASFGAKVALNTAGAELTYAATAKKPTLEGAVSVGLGGAAMGAVDWGMDTVVAPSLDTFFRMYSGPVARATGAAADGIFSNVGGNIASYYAQKKALEAK